MMDDVTKHEPVYDHFSENKYLDHYKQNLVETGNVDHIVPFKHSQDKRGSKMNKLRQPNIRLKMYPNSTCNELAREFRTSNSNQEGNHGNFIQKNPSTNWGKPANQGSEGPLTKTPTGNLLHQNQSKATITIMEEFENPESKVKLGSNENQSFMETNRGGSVGSISGTKQGMRRTLIFGRRKGKEIKEQDKIDRLINIYFK